MIQLKPRSHCTDYLMYPKLMNSYSFFFFFPLLPSCSSILHASWMPGTLFRFAWLDTEWTRTRSPENRHLRKLYGWGLKGKGILWALQEGSLQPNIILKTSAVFQSAQSKDSIPGWVMTVGTNEICYTPNIPCFTSFIFFWIFPSVKGSTQLEARVRTSDAMFNNNFNYLMLSWQLNTNLLTQKQAEVCQKVQKFQVGYVLVSPGF